MERTTEQASAIAQGAAGPVPADEAGGPACAGHGVRRGAWRGRAGAAAGAAGLCLALGADSGWMQLAGVFLTTLGMHFWVMSRQQA
ncbi:hypothetical protein AB4Z48_39970 [Cupriavidus sp. 2TAF22]|uniref:hypothetical protein n=1 Tax=unclassified Cupriavidus TaxID=2640874 RepID=UPI003F8DF711